MKKKEQRREVKIQKCARAPPATVAPHTIEPIVKGSFALLTLDTIREQGAAEVPFSEHVLLTSCEYYK